MMAQGVRGPPVAENDNAEGYRMANLCPADTGLPLGVWLMERGAAPPEDVWVRVRGASIAVCPVPHVVKGRLMPGDFALAVRWIVLNREAIIAYWNGEIGTVELVGRLRPLVRDA
jgi:hypothetical protein